MGQCIHLISTLQAYSGSHSLYHRCTIVGSEACCLLQVAKFLCGGSSGLSVGKHKVHTLWLYFYLQSLPLM
uniref:Uncharacterized protein n=1 Tax=Arundo donax TaxID=35708 RepID=A0A0A8XPP2_ARUDO